MEDESPLNRGSNLVLKAPEPQGGPRWVFRELEHARHHLAHLYEISKLLTGFEGVARTFPRLMELAAQALPLRTALLLEGVDGDGAPLLERPRLTAWRTAGVTTAQLSWAARQAAFSYAYLVAVAEVEPQGEAVAELEGSGLSLLPVSPEEAAPTFVTLPLVAKGRIFGALQVEASGGLGLAEDGVAFVDAVASQLATALDRHYALKREVHLRERAESLERLHRGLLERERQARQDLEDAHQRQSFLVEASAVLASSLDYRLTLPRIARLLVPRWTDCCAIDLVLKGSLAGERIAMLAAEPPGGTPGRESFVGQVLASHPWMAFSANPRNLPEESVAVEQTEWEGFPSNLRVPIRMRGRTLGVLSLICARRGCYGPADALLFETLAQRIATAVDSALLYEQAQEAVRWREDLLAVVSHDLKSPLLVVRMNAELLLRAARPPGEERRRHGRRQMELILLAVDQMRDLIGGLLDRARSQGMPMPLAAEPWAVEVLFQNALEVMRPLALSKFQELVVEVYPGVPQVRADKDRVLQVLTNLVGNAIKYTPASGTITLRAKKVDGQVRISVKDNGPGISAEDVPHLFERFWRATGVLERGTGLGLSIAKSIVEAHGGTLWVETHPGVGSTFFFTLPGVEP